MKTPVALTGKNLLALMLVSALLSAGLAVAAAGFARPSRADAARANPAASTASVVRELKGVRRELAGLRRDVKDIIGTSEYDAGSLRAEFHNQIGNPFSPSVKHLLRDICRNTGSGIC